MGFINRWCQIYSFDNTGVEYLYVITGVMIEQILIWLLDEVILQYIFDCGAVVDIIWILFG